MRILGGVASPARRLPGNVPGDFFVDSTCIDCAACRWIAPATFDEHEGQSRVHRQPAIDAERLAAAKALVACPTASIGSASKAGLDAAAAAFPDPIDGPVHHCGYHDEATFGATSYLVVRPEGNVLVDSPRFARPLVRRLEELGGVALHFLTHRDDVGDHARFHDHFGARRVLHAGDVTEDTHDVEVQVQGTEPVALADDLVVIPTPGHTRGSACLLLSGRYLFSGDHAAWSPARGRVYAFRDACWYDWRVQAASMARLAEHRFEWLLPGHGRRVRLDAAAMQASLRDCVAWMRGWY